MNDVNTTIEFIGYSRAIRDCLMILKKYEEDTGSEYTVRNLTNRVLDCFKKEKIAFD